MECEMKNLRSRSGPEKVEDPRNNCVSVRLSDNELEWLDNVRAKKSKIYRRGEYLRMAAFNALPPVVSEINNEAWEKLSRAAANLNQIAFKLNSGEFPEIEKISTALAEFRNKLIGL